jgi:iron complex outermembrane receptor protein
VLKLRIRPLLVAGLLSGAAFSPALAQEAATPAEEPATPAAPAAEAATAAQPADDLLDDGMEDEEGEEIVVTGTRERGAVLGDIEPEVQLSGREIRALGASNLTELLDAIAPQTRSGRGRGEDRPVVLLNGRRISGFSEIRDLPPEAIQRVDILPEEVALKYGYRADQRVVNFVLRRRFRAVTTEVEGGLATDGGRARYELDANLLRIDGAGRWSVDGEYEHVDPLFESERDIIQSDPTALFDAGDFRTLLAETDTVSLNGTLNRMVFGDVSATINTTFDANSSRSFLGLRPGSSRSGLVRESDGLAGHVGLALNGAIAAWQWSLTSNYDRASNDSLTETSVGSDRSQTLTDSLDTQLVANGSLFSLPAGDVSTTFRAGFDARGLESDTVRGGVGLSRDLSREHGSFQANVDLPIASRRRDVLGAIGNLSVNANAEVEHFSDFGTLRTLGAGVNWEPINQVRLLFSMTDEDGAPSMQQLGDPVLLTPNVRVFDFVRGETVDISRLEGGNPDLIADNRRVMKLGLTVRPFSEEDVSFTADYTSNRTRNPIASFPTATAEIEAAFPERFERDADGRLLRVDARPLNFARSSQRQLRWGINFSKRIGPPPPEGGFRGRFGGQGGAPGAPAAPGAAPPAGQGAPPQPATGQPGQPEGAPGQPSEARQGGGRGQGGGFRGGGGGRGGFGGFGGGGRGGRIQLALYHNWRFEDKVLIRPGVPELDFLNGSASGSRGGRPRHELEFQGGLFKNGLGARVTGTWQEGTFVRGGPDGRGGTRGDLFFSDTVAVNLRLFAELGRQRSLVRDHPWLRGSRISLNIDNLFNSRPDVRDAAGVTPLSYQPGYLDPLGRSVRLSFRKLFF